MKKFISSLCLVASFAVTGCALAAEDSATATQASGTSNGLMQQEHNSKAAQKAKQEQNTKGGRPDGVSNPNALSTK